MFRDLAKRTYKPQETFDITAVSGSNLTLSAWPHCEFDHIFENGIGYVVDSGGLYSKPVYVTTIVSPGVISVSDWYLHEHPINSVEQQAEYDEHPLVLANFLHGTMYFYSGSLLAIYRALFWRPGPPTYPNRWSST